MPKCKPPPTATTTTDDEEDKSDWARVWIPLAQAQALLSIASEVEGDSRYYERVYALVAAARPLVDVALNLAEERYEGDVRNQTPKGRS